MPFRRKKFIRKGPLPFRYVFLITFIIFILLTFQGVWIINKGIEPILMNVATSYSKQFATKAINMAVNKRLLSEDLEVDKLITIEKTDEGDVASIGWNPLVVNAVLSRTTQRVEDFLDNLETGKVPPPGVPPDVQIKTQEEEEAVMFEVPLGQATNISLLSNLGPKVPVRMVFVGNVQSDVKDEVSEYGINNSLIKISIVLTVNVQVVIPFETEVAEVTTEVPVDIRVIQGKVPYFYNSGGGSGVNPSIVPPTN